MHETCAEDRPNHSPVLVYVTFLKGPVVFLTLKHVVEEIEPSIQIVRMGEAVKREFQHLALGVPEHVAKA